MVIIVARETGNTSVILGHNNAISRKRPSHLMFNFYTLSKSKTVRI